MNTFVTYSGHDLLTNLDGLRSINELRCFQIDLLSSINADVI